MKSKTTLNSVNLATRYPRKHEKINAVILGAGFSAEFGYPLAGDLLKEIFTSGAADSKKMIDFNRFLTHFYQDFQPDNAKYPDIEDLLGMLEVAKHYATIRAQGAVYLNCCKISSRSIQRDDLILHR